MVRRFVRWSGEWSGRFSGLWSGRCPVCGPVCGDQGSFGLLSLEESPTKPFSNRERVSKSTDLASAFRG